MRVTLHSKPIVRCGPVGLGLADALLEPLRDEVHQMHNEDSVADGQRLTRWRATQADLMLAARFADVTYGTRHEHNATPDQQQPDPKPDRPQEPRSTIGSIAYALTFAKRLLFPKKEPPQASPTKPKSMLDCCAAHEHAPPIDCPAGGEAVRKVGCEHPGCHPRDWARLKLLADPAEQEAAVHALLHPTDREESSHKRSISGSAKDKVNTLLRRDETVKDKYTGHRRDRHGKMTKSILSALAQYPDVCLLAHLESDSHTLDGQCSVWISDVRRLVIVAWRGTDSATDQKMDLKSVRLAPFGADTKRTGFKVGAGFYQQCVGGQSAGSLLCAGTVPR